ncbi:MAG TPA: LytR C-terminal domain-containing protein, partial [Bacteroidota bacterium]|nr:LytR C-terminal domain-containing protein [Bacteroidota bacterium]
DPVRSGSPSRSTIQLDVLNGCGASGAGTAMTAYLRARGFDVVEYRNYRSFDVQETLVIDRAGNRENAEKVAYALGVAKGNIIEQINEDYYVDVSVLIGRDYASLKSSH